MCSGSVCNSITALSKGMQKMKREEGGNRAAVNSASLSQQVFFGGGRVEVKSKKSGRRKGEETRSGVVTR